MEDRTAHTDDNGPILFFDGVCGLCNRFVDSVLRRDRAGRIRVAPLQGETAKHYLTPEDCEQLKTVVFLANGQTYRYSSAIVRTLWRIGGPAAAQGALFWLVPKPLRDLAYRFVARNRYRWFGKKSTCRLPTAEERDRFLP